MPAPVKILSVVGARPNFMKVAPLHRAFGRYPDLFESKIVHTGQHYDARMSDVFFTQLELPEPHYYLGIGGGSGTEQTARIMLAMEKIIDADRPDVLVVVGDVNSTVAAALVGVKAGIPVAHVEAGLRSFDRGMPEEINRIVTDSISDWLFVTEQAGLDNLAREGVPAEKVFFTGNCMIDSLVHLHPKSAGLDNLDQLGLRNTRYVLMTMHRPSNVDTVEGLGRILQMLEEITSFSPVVFPLHPRTRAQLRACGLDRRADSIQNVHWLEPQGYLEFLQLMEHAAIVLTDSGGIQEETTFLQVPCLTFRSSTERPVTADLGTNVLLADLDPEKAVKFVREALAGRWKQGIVPPLWDGRAAERIVEIIKKNIE